MDLLSFDMDGLLCDFAGGSCAAHGRDLPVPRNELPWDYPVLLGFDSSADPAFWAPLENHDFWADLPPLQDGLDLFAAAETAFGPHALAILSDGSCRCSTDGKRTWLDRHLPGYRRRAVFAAAKDLAAAPGKVLVDDKDSHVREFRAAGGEAVLVPRSWNARRAEVDALGRFDVARLLADLEAAARRAA